MARIAAVGGVREAAGAGAVSLRLVGAKSRKNRGRGGGAPAPVRGGDGGVAGVVRAAGTRHALANLEVVLTAWRAEEVSGERAGRSRAGRAGSRRCVALFETRDPSDRAHAARDHRQLLVPACDDKGRVLPGSRARRYPMSCMTSRGVSHDSAFDQLAAIERWLAREGIQVGTLRSISAVQLELARDRLREDLRLRDVIDRDYRRAVDRDRHDAAGRWLRDNSHPHRS